MNNLGRHFLVTNRMTYALLFNIFASAGASILTIFAINGYFGGHFVEVGKVTSFAVIPVIIARSVVDVLLVPVGYWAERNSPKAAFIMIVVLYLVSGLDFIADVLSVTGHNVVPSWLPIP